MAEAINLKLPSSLYQRLKEMAQVSNKSLDDILIQSIQTGLPPTIDHVPERFKADLLSLNKFENDVLNQIIHQDLTTTNQELYAKLLAKNEQEGLNNEERAKLNQLREEADLLMFRRAYASALLKWRGQRVTTHPAAP